MFSGYPRFIYIVRLLQMILLLIGFVTMFAVAVLAWTEAHVDWLDAIRSCAVGFGSFFAIQWVLANRPGLIFDELEGNQ